MRILPALLIAASALLAGCGSTDSTHITKLERVPEAAGGSTEPLGEENEIPADGIFTAEQMATIAGKDGTYTFIGEDGDTGIRYVWAFDGMKIQNPTEQNLLVSFPLGKVEEMKKKANNASVGLGVKLSDVPLAAPGRLTLTLDEKWDADTVLLCKAVDGGLERMAEAEIGKAKRGKEKVTTLAFDVTEMGDTYYLVGGKTRASQPAGGEASASGEVGAEGSASAGSGDTAAANTGTGQQAPAGSTGGGQDGGAAYTEAGAPSGSSHTCTISIECSTIFGNTDKLKEEKAAFVPADGWLLYPSVVEFEPGETAYDVLYRVCRDAGIQIDAKYTPAYGSYYVQGIGQLYEFDCGDLSGWMYSVNGWFPNYGTSSYVISDGDVVEWRYTCDLGRDVGGSGAVGG